MENPTKRIRKTRYVNKHDTHKGRNPAPWYQLKIPRYTYLAVQRVAKEYDAPMSAVISWLVDAMYDYYLKRGELKVTGAISFEGSEDKYDNN